MIPNPDRVWRYAEALAERFTAPIPVYDPSTGAVTTYGATPAERVPHTTLLVTYTSPTGTTSFQVESSAAVAEVLASEYEKELGLLCQDIEWGFARVNARHQPETIKEWVPCKEHADRYLARQTSCPMCAIRPVTVCSNTTCESWPCPDHLALHGETATTCTHGRST